MHAVSFKLMIRLRLRRSRGVALLSTLILLALVTVLIVTFFFSVGSMREQSSHSLSDFNLGNLRDTAINTVIEQLRDGTTQADEFWASQPGAIRTYSRESGQESQIFKLYSSSETRLQNVTGLPGAAAKSLETDVPATWNSLPGVYVDINEPEIFSSDGQVHFPIVDPRMFSSTVTSTPEGFSYSTAQPVSSAEVEGVITPATAATVNEQRVPMPVMWIYLLRDGTRGTLSSDGKFVPLVTTGNVPGVSNPIVGRMAWWVDDESAKININTASEAIPWDTPKAATPEDYAYAEHTPVKNEVQRFGGHPATTCLSTVFFPGVDMNADSSEGRQRFQQIYQLVPRISGDAGYIASGTAQRQAIAFDNDRLYATVDEMLYAPDRNRQPLINTLGVERLRQLRFLLTANSNAPETTVAGTPRVSLWPVFLNDTDTGRTAYDRLLTRAATIANKPFYFRRNDSKTSTNEFAGAMTSNADLEKYLLTLTDRKDMGYTQSFIQKYDGDVLATSRDVENMAVGLVSFLETIRGTNLHDTTIAPSGSPVVPYANARELFRGTRVPGQIPSTNPSNFAYSRGQLNDHLLRLGPLGREYTLSEFGVVFSYAAEHSSDGTKINEPLVTKLNLPQGFKAIQAAAVFEAFCPAQGYTMISPGAGISADFSLVTINGRKPVSIVTDAGTGAGTVLSRWGPYGWGSDNNNLRWLGGQNQAGSDGQTSSALTIPDLYAKPWWVGWGGSGGTRMFAGSDINVGIGGGLSPSTDPLALSTGATNEIPAIYTRGYFIVPAGEATMTLGMANPQGGTEPYVEIGIWARRVGIDRFDHCKFGRFPVAQIPVPSLASNPSLLKTSGSQTWPLTWRERYDRSRANNYSNPELIDNNDTVRTLVVRHSDYRLAHLRRREHTGPVESRTYAPHPYYFDSARRHAHSFTQSGGEPEPQAYFQRGLVDTPYADNIRPDFVISPGENDYEAQMPTSYSYATDPEITRDWNNGTGLAPDGAYWNKPDDMARVFDGSTPPYFHRQWDGAQDGGNIQNDEETIAPNQQVPSAVLFGGIPSAAGDAIPWTTYLFRPAMGEPHLGSANESINGPLQGTPPDHRLLDWFWMPVVQPYAVSEPFSTAGKINMNYRLAPFGYIKRATGLHAVFKSERMLAIPTLAGESYKDLAKVSDNAGWRHKIDAEETLRQFETRFNGGQVFRFASEICDQYLIPEGRTVENVVQFWNEHKLTGDNTLERPYANIYPRLTTQSNAYTIHLVVETLQKARSSPVDEFVEGQDLVTGRYRGEALVERYIDPNDPDTPDYIAASQTGSTVDPLDRFYNWRIRHIRRFAP